MMNRIFTSIRASQNIAGSPRRACKDCGQPATKDALFDVGNGIAVVERYCDQCAKVIENNSNNRSSV
ncbi:MAG: hypothetical protein QXX64_04950 [Nitrososphaera sp.]|uniref:Uncharacterized protein n=1 Tax=Nitrososphaera gargensis (strain Ga9.2) TaxID=1237085 RepID=K0ILB4_NITGG|nr:hypothetical protein [Candidatus Nitrososphaera gargensis]AFU56984.1 hypothetical protein Ngar_c00340 [Candidatus Nitrososphaera gargensis Ga9.2]